MTSIAHTLVCGATRSGKSAAELARLVPRARAADCAIVLLDPPGTLASQFLLHLDALGVCERVLYDRLSDTDRVPGYAWLVPSGNQDPLQRAAEDEERVRELAAILLRRRGIEDMASTPLIEEGVLAALRLLLRQRAPVPFFWVGEAFTLGSPARAQLLENCSDPELVRKFHNYGSLSPTARRTETGPAERILRAVCGSPAFWVRSQGATFDFGRFLDDRGILIVDGMSRGNLSRDAASIMMGAVALRVLQHCRTGAKSRVVLVLDEAVNAGLIGVHESRALAEAGKWRLEFHVIVQDPFNFPSEEIRNNVLQNCGRHEWFRQGSPNAARLAAEDIGTPLLDPLQVHHTEFRIRTRDAGFDRIMTRARGEWFERDGRRLGRTTSWNTVLWPRRTEVKDAQDRYTTLVDQVVLLQKELMSLETGYRFVRSDTVTPRPEYVPLLADSWAEIDGSGDDLLASGAGLAEAKLRSALTELKRRPLYRTPARPSLVLGTDASGHGAARKLAARAGGSARST